MTFTKNTKFKIIIYFLLITLIIVKGYLFSTKYQSDSYYNEYILFIENLKSADEDKVSYYVRGGDYFKDKFILNIYKDKYSKNEIDLTCFLNFKYGDFVKVKGKISVPEKLNNPGEFDYKLYIYSNNIYGLINTYSKVEKVERGLSKSQKILKTINNVKEKISDIIESQMNYNEASVTKALVFGDKQDLDEDLKEKFNNTNITHLMSVSGTHIISFMMILNVVLRNKKNKPNIFKSCLTILFIIAYIIFTGISISVLRAGIMVIINIICKQLKIKNSILKSLKITCILILVFRPFSIFSTSFILSFLSVIGIILFKKYFYEAFTKFKIKNNVIRRIISYIYTSIAITLSVNLMILPIQISSFNKISFPLLIPNLVMGFLSIPIRIMGMIGVMVSFYPKISLYIFSVVNVITKVFLISVNLINKISISISSKTMPLLFFVLYYLFILSLFLTFKISRLIKNNKKKIESSKYNYVKLKKVLRITTVLLLVIVISSIVLINIYSIYFSKYIYFFNVKQGEMSYVKCGKESIIVDIGSLSNSLPFNVINNFFKKENIHHVDLLIISHMDMDHISGVEELLKNYDVSKVIYTVPKEKNKNYMWFKQLLKNLKVDFEEVKEGDEIKLKNINIKILLPDKEYIKRDSENANSLICLVNAKNTSILYTGDVTKETEEKLIKKYNKLKNIDILKVSHHGSKTSTSEYFIKKILPKYAVVSACKKYYGHPHEDTLDTLKKNNIPVFLTEKIGAIKFNLN